MGEPIHQKDKALFQIFLQGARPTFDIAQEQAKKVQNNINAGQRIVRMRNQAEVPFINLKQEINGFDKFIVDEFQKFKYDKRRQKDMFGKVDISSDVFRGLSTSQQEELVGEFLVKAGIDQNNLQDDEMKQIMRDIRDGSGKVLDNIKKHPSVQQVKESKQFTGQLKREQDKTEIDKLFEKNKNIFLSGIGADQGAKTKMEILDQIQQKGMNIPGQSSLVSHRTIDDQKMAHIFGSGFLKNDNGILSTSMGDNVHKGQKFAESMGFKKLSNMLTVFKANLGHERQQNEQQHRFQQQQKQKKRKEDLADMKEAPERPGGSEPKAGHHGGQANPAQKREHVVQQQQNDHENMKNLLLKTNKNYDSKENILTKDLKITDFDDFNSKGIQQFIEIINELNDDDQGYKTNAIIGLKEQLKKQLEKEKAAVKQPKEEEKKQQAPQSPQQNQDFVFVVNELNDKNFAPKKNKQSGNLNLGKKIPENFFENYSIEDLDKFLEYFTKKVNDTDKRATSITNLTNVRNKKIQQQKFPGGVDK